MSSYKDYQRLDRLKRRAEYLRQQIDENWRPDHGYDKGELAALEWAIPILETKLINNSLSINKSMGKGHKLPSFLSTPKQEQGE